MNLKPGKNEIVIVSVKKIDISNLFKSNAVGLDDFRQRACGRLMINKEEANQLIRKLGETDKAEIDYRKKTLYFK